MVPGGSAVTQASQTHATFETMTEDEWISTADAAEVMDLSYNQTLTVLKAYDCGHRAKGWRRWRRVDVFAIRDLRAEAKAAPPIEVARRRPRQRRSAQVRTEQSYRPQTVDRPCMCCRRPFPSEGAHNRLCDACRHDGGLPSHSLST